MKNVLSKLLTLLIIIMILGTGITLEITLNRYRLEKTNRLELSNEVKHEKDGRTEIDWKKLKERNPDVIAWISLKDSEINYPVLKGKDNEYYLHRDIDGNYLYDGCIYVDAFNPAPFRSANTVIYGHKMRSGAMFAGLKNYADKDFWKEHPVINLYTPSASYDLKVVAYTRDDAYSDLYRTIDENVTAEDLKDYEDIYFTKKNFLDLVREKAMIISDETLSEADTYVTLSTCVYSEGDERQQIICTVNEKKTDDISKSPTNEAGKGPTWLNKFLIAQIVVAALMISIIAGMVKPRRKSK